MACIRAFTVQLDLKTTVSRRCINSPRRDQIPMKEIR